MTYPKVDFLPADEQSGAPSGVAASPRFPEIEERILRYWAQDGTFLASVEAREAGAGRVQRVRLLRRAALRQRPAALRPPADRLRQGPHPALPDHARAPGRAPLRLGLPRAAGRARGPARLGLRTKADILELGIEKFNDACRESVLKYTDEWQEYVTRQARWVDFEHDYKTLDPTYMECVLWAFKTLYDKGLVYEGMRVLPYCWNDETPLSNHELRMDEEVYQQRQDPSVTVWVALETGERLMAWTTTPWTLPSNLAMAVGPDVDYVVVEHEGERYILAEARLACLRARAGRGRGRADRRPAQGQRAGRAALRPALHFFADSAVWGTEAAYRVIAGRPRHHRRRHRRGAHGARLR